jgi:hypothetical protein
MTRFVSFLMASAGTVVLSAQTIPRRADIRGGAGNRGKCTIEVVVDGVAEVEIRGDNAILRNLGGRPPEWRRFVCDSVMPPNPVDFHFAGVDGRGRQELAREPREGGPAVVRIEDKQGGSEGYTFDITWANVGSRQPEVHDRDQGDWHRGRDEWARGDNWRERIFERVREDVTQIQRVTWPGGSDQYRLERTKQQLNELQGQMVRGHFDDRQLDDVIRALDRVVDDNRMAPRDREILRDDIRKLRDLREHRH